MWSTSCLSSSPAEGLYSWLHTIVSLLDVGQEPSWKLHRGGGEKRTCLPQFQKTSRERTRKFPSMMHLPCSGNAGLHKKMYQVLLVCHFFPNSIVRILEIPFRNDALTDSHGWKSFTVGTVSFSALFRQPTAFQAKLCEDCGNSAAWRSIACCYNGSLNFRLALFCCGWKTICRNTNVPRT